MQPFEPESTDHSIPRSGNCRGATLGGIAVHAISFGCFFVKGFIFGGCAPAFGATGPGNREYFFRGGLNEAANLFLVYVFTLGIVPLILTVIGAGVGSVLMNVRYAKTHRKPSKIAPSPKGTNSRQ